MESEAVQAFNKALYSMYDARPPISKQKIFDITKTAMNAIRHFKHVVAIVEKFLVKCRNEYKISGLYVIDSIIRQARKQYKYKDVYGPRFANNLQNTFINVLSCDVNERPKAVRVINLWLANKIFDEDVIEPLLQYCRATGLEVDTEKVEIIVKGDKANMQIYGAEAVSFGSSKKSPHILAKLPTTPPKPRTPPLELRPQTPPMEESSFEIDQDKSLNEHDILNLLEKHESQLAKSAADDKQLLGRIQKIVNDRILEKLEIERRRQGNIKNLLSREFDYSDEDDDEDGRLRNESNLHAPSRESIIMTAKSLFFDGSLSQDFSSIHREIAQRRNSMPRPSQTLSHQPTLGSATNYGPIGVPPPMVSDAMPSFISYDRRNLPPPGVESSFCDQPSNGSTKSDGLRNSEKSSRKRIRSKTPDRDYEYRDSRGYVDDPRRRDRGDPRDRYTNDRNDRRGTSHSDRKQRRSRSPGSSHRDRDRDRGSSKGKDRDRDKERDYRQRDEEERIKDKDKERRKNGLPTRPKEAHVLIASRTLWFGRIPANCSESDIRDAVKEAGIPEKINIVAPRACAYVTMKERRAAFKIIDRLAKDLQVLKKTVKLSWATIQGLKDNERLMDYWDMDRGIALIPFAKLPDPLNSLLEGAYLDIDTLPSYLKGLYTSKGPKNVDSVPLTQSQQVQIPLPSTFDSTNAVAAQQPALLSGSVPNAIFPPAANIPGNIFNFQHQMSIPPPFTGLNSATSNVNSSVPIPSDPKQHPPAPNMATIAGIASFPGFPPPGAPPFPPFPVPTPSNTATAATFLNNPQQQQSFLLPGAVLPNAQTTSNSGSTSNNTSRSQFNNNNNNNNGRGGFNSNRGRGGRFSQHSGSNEFGNRGRGNFRGGFRGGQRGGWSGNNKDRPRNNGNLGNTQSDGDNSNGNFDSNHDGRRSNRSSGQFGSGNNSYMGGRNGFGAFNNNFPSHSNYGNDDKLSDENEFSKRGSRFSDSRVTPAETDSLLSSVSTTNDEGHSKTGFLPAFASTMNAPPILDCDKPVNTDISNLSSISLPQLSAATISNLRDIIAASSSSIPAKSNENPPREARMSMDDSDEYDDNDDDYFRVLNLRQNKTEAECVSTTQWSNKNNQRMEDEVSSTTFYDESDRQTVSSAAENKRDGLQLEHNADSSIIDDSIKQPHSTNFQSLTSPMVKDADTNSVMDCNE